MLIGVDIGGTKCAVCLWEKQKLIKKVKFPTENKEKTLEKIESTVSEFSKGSKIEAVGISCGGPLDSQKGVILSPPNLSDWERVPITELLSRCADAPAQLLNDANACALAEWKHGAGKGTENMIFLTFGTGMGAGLILNGRLYEGANGMAGEIGHIRLRENGPVGYGKAGSVEGFCSGGGIAQIGKAAVTEAYRRGMSVDFCKESEIDFLNAKIIGDAAEAGDALAKEIYRKSAHHLGAVLAILIDVFNPQAIVIGSIFSRSEALFREEMEKVIKDEALPLAVKMCKICPSKLGEDIGDLAARTIAEGIMEKNTYV